MDQQTKTTTITANLEALEKVLYEANVRASEAVAAIKQNEANQAIGCALEIENMLKQATAFYTAALVVHRA